MADSKFAVFVDLENCGAKVTTLNSILEKVKIRGDILLGRVYGYTDKYGDLTETLLSNTFTVVPSLRYGYAQKNNADIHLVIDALEVAYTNPLIDSFCIVSGDSDYNPLVGKLKSMGKFVLGISRSEAASTIFINACNEFQFMETVGGSKSLSALTLQKKKTNGQSEETADLQELNKLIDSILSEQTNKDELYASELKGIVLRLKPGFSEKAYGCASFGKLLAKLEKQFATFHIRNDNFNIMVSPAVKEVSQGPQLTKEDWRTAFRDILKRYKDDGFERINPSILKGDILEAYPDFQEKHIGFKRFSDVMKQLERDGLLTVEMDDQKTMLIQLI